MTMSKGPPPTSSKPTPRSSPRSSNAATLAAAFEDLGELRGVGFEEVGGGPFDIVINATSASLSGEIPPIAPGAIGPQTVCYDLAYGKSATASVQWAQRQGCAGGLRGA